MVEAWIADDPDAGDRAESQALLDRAFADAGTGDGPGGDAGSGLDAGTGAGTAIDTGSGPDADAVAELRDRFAGRLKFGTAGLRGAVAAGPNRMNRAVVRAATAAVAGWLLGSCPDSARDALGSGVARGLDVGVVVGCDARHRSAEFADEVAGVLAGAGITVHVLPRPCPTPLVAFAVRHLGAAAGVMITASHNRAADNGYKLYLSDGAQVIPPVDAEIEKRIAGLGPLSQIPVAGADSPLITRHDDGVVEAYLDAVVATAAGPVATGPTIGGSAAVGPKAAGPVPGRTELKVVYTPMHGVAGDLMLRAIRQAGFARPHVVAAQAEPDPDFPTVAFPNPEEPGALDLALADARRLGADLVIASDPDGDRLAVAVPDLAPSACAGRGAGADGWRVLTGDQVGALLGASLLERTAVRAAPEARLVASTIVSSTLLAKIAAAAGVRYAETLTGFKWIARAADGVPGTRFVFGYEEALGYEVGDVVRDKDGIGAALAMLWLASAARAAGRSVLEVYDELETAHGVHLTSQLTLRTADQAHIMSRLRSDPPAALGGQPLSALIDLAAGERAKGAARPPGERAPGEGPSGEHWAPGEGPSGEHWAPGEGPSGEHWAPGEGAPRADVLIFRLPGARVVLRPSGTEPKIKCYIEIVEPLAGRSLPAAREAAAGRLAPLRSALEAVLAQG
jgi:phosphomannomutase